MKVGACCPIYLYQSYKSADYASLLFYVLIAKMTGKSLIMHKKCPLCIHIVYNYKSTAHVNKSTYVAPTFYIKFFLLKKYSGFSDIQY